LSGQLVAGIVDDSNLVWALSKVDLFLDANRLDTDKGALFVGTKADVESIDRLDLIGGVGFRAEGRNGPFQTTTRRST